MKVAYLHPNNALLNQYNEEFPRTLCLRKKSSYRCAEFPEYNVEEAKENLKKDGHPCNCKHCPYTRAIIMAQRSNRVTCNYHTYMAHRMKSDVLIVDEAHNLIPFLQELGGVVVWQHIWNYPSWVKDYSTLLRYLKEYAAYVDKHKCNYEGKAFKISRGMRKLIKVLEEGSGKFFIRKTVELYRGKERDCIKAYPLDVSEFSDILVKERGPSGRPMKVILLSATINKKEIIDLGLDKKRTVYLESASPIPKEHRPIFPMDVHSMGIKHWDVAVPKLIEALTELLDIPDSQGKKGFIHAPYSLATQIRKHLGSHPRLMFHTKDNKMRVLDDFIRAPTDSGVVMVASGLEEGVDLKYEIAQWQAICKIPYPSLGDPVIAERARQDELWYAWQALKLVMQAAGRVCRSPDDWGSTFVLDSCFASLYNKMDKEIANWFKEAIKW